MKCRTISSAIFSRRSSRVIKSYSCGRDERLTIPTGSLSAGAYLCNQVLYVVLHHIALKSPGARAGFLHVPSLPEQVVADPDLPSMSLETMLKGVRAAIEAIAGHEAPVNLPF